MPLWCNGCERWVANSDTDSSAAHYNCPGKQEPRLGVLRPGEQVYKELLSEEER